jgi:MSHA pilin protein MshD
MRGKGLTLIELVITIVVLGFAVSALMGVWADIMWRCAYSEATADATLYAQQLMEEIKTRNYDEREEYPWTGSASFGVDTGEYRTDSMTFDDIDDYVGSTDPVIVSPAAGFSCSVTVEYMVTDAAKNWQVCAAPVSCTDAAQDQCTRCQECCYKRITVKVSNTDRRIGNVTLTSMMAGY